MSTHKLSYYTHPAAHIFSYSEQLKAQTLHDTNLPKMDKVLKWAMLLMEASKFLMKMLSPLKIFAVGSSLDHMTCIGLPKKSSKLNMSRARSAEGTKIMKLHLN